VGSSTVAALDSRLAHLASSGGRLRLLMAEGLEELARIGGHHDLGFATVECYALERCGRSARWVQSARALVRRLAMLPDVRAALMAGHIGFSLAQVLAGVARPEDEEWWLLWAARTTVREMRRMAREFMAAGPVVAVEDEPHTMLTVTVDQEDVWLFERVRMLGRHIAGPRMEDTLDAMLAEGTTTLLAAVERDALVPFGDAPDEEASQRQWEQELARYRKEAEIEPEFAFHGRQQQVADSNIDAPPRWAGDAMHIDAQLREVAAQLARRDLLLGEAANAFWQADGWRRLGYALEAQYAQERLGMSASSVKAKRTLARRANTLPAVKAAVNDGTLAYEVARLVTEVSVSDTAVEWVSRARERTVKHLREEVSVAQVLARLGVNTMKRPPSEATMAEVAEIERKVITGTEFQHAESQITALAKSPGAGNAGTGGMVGKLDACGRVTLRFRVPVSTRRYYRWLEQAFQRVPRDVGFFRYLCVKFIEVWQPRHPSSEAYASIYARDLYRCTSPVCTRRDVTPHHLRFRSRGGDDGESNVTSLCVWCHLEGVHGGSLRVEPPASAMRWTLGREPHTIVDGRRRTAA
jgi:hypothetical protein